ncbi:hypothetical protein PTKIN_Ptkin12aG0152100 [Pterospermum kingtungense]
MRLRNHSILEYMTTFCKAIGKALRYEIWFKSLGDPKLSGLKETEVTYMDNFPKVLCGWSWEENKLFELALAVVDEEHPHRWEVVAAMVGGAKSAEEVQKHYVILLEDLQFIESGQLDHKLGEAQSCIQVDCAQQSLCWTDEDIKYTLFSFLRAFVASLLFQFLIFFPSLSPIMFHETV